MPLRRIFAVTACQMGTRSGLRHPLPTGATSRNGTERFLTLRTPRIVPSNRRSEVRRPPCSASAIGDPASRMRSSSSCHPRPGERYTATSAAPPCHCHEKQERCCAAYGFCVGGQIAALGTIYVQRGRRVSRPLVRFGLCRRRSGGSQGFPAFPRAPKLS
jgi:hypothetical protein